MALSTDYQTAPEVEDEKGGFRRIWQGRNDPRHRKGGVGGDLRAHLDTRIAGTGRSATSGPHPF